MSCNHHFWSLKKTCYFCNHNLRWRDITLADGCDVPACGICFAYVVKGRKLAEERGYYDPLRLPVSNKVQPQDGEQVGIDNGRHVSMAIIPDVEESDGVPYIGKKLFTDKNVRKIKIISEFKMEECNYQGNITVKPVGMVETGIPDPKEAKWQMNKATQKYFKEKYGGDSSKWITDEWHDIKLASAGNAQPSIYPTAVSLEKTF